MLDEHYGPVEQGVSDPVLEREAIGAIVPQVRSGAWRLRSCRVTHVRKQRRKRIVYYQLCYEDAAGSEPQIAELVAKVYGSDRGAKANGVLRSLWEVGFRPPSSYQVSEPFGYSSELGTLLQGRAAGQTWAEFLDGDAVALATASTEAARWLIQLQETTVHGDAMGWERDVASVRRQAEELTATFPAHAARLDHLASRLTERLRAPEVPLVAAHGDYHPKNVFLAPDHVTVIDFDTFGRREAAFDVGYAIGQLLIISYLRLGGFAPGARAALAFWHHYGARGAAPWSRVAPHMARTFLQSLHYELCTLRNGRVDLLALWADRIEEGLEATDPAPLERVQRV